MVAVVHGVIDDVKKSLGRVGGEVNHDPRPGRDGAGDLDVEHHLGIGVGRVGRVGSRRVLRTIDGNGDHLGRGKPQVLKIRLQFRGPKSTAARRGQLDDADHLPRAIDVGREIVNRGHLVGIEIRPTGRPGCDLAVDLADPEMGPDVGTSVKPEDRLDDRPQVGRHRGGLVVVTINGRIYARTF